MSTCQKKTDADRPARRSGIRRRLFHSLKKNTFAPQWIAFRDEEPHLRALAGWCMGRVEIGSGERRLEKHLRAIHVYRSGLSPADTLRIAPDVWGDGSRLPFQEGPWTGSFCWRSWSTCPIATGLMEASRVVAPAAGAAELPLSLSIHDAPYDFSRLTQFARANGAEAGLEIIRLTSAGTRRSRRTVGLLAWRKRPFSRSSSAAWQRWRFFR